MRRQAIIIGNNTGKDAPKFLKGVNLDLANYKNYLISQGGGSWTDLFEIQILHNKTRTEILHAIRNCNTDYAFVVFTGHGYYKTNDNQTYVCVADGEISEDELRVRSAAKQSLILDCCREKVTIQSAKQSFNATGEQLSTPILEYYTNKTFSGTTTLNKSIEGGSFNSQLTNRLADSNRIIYNSKIKFENALLTCSSGLFTGYACKIDQTSSDNPTSGGVFSTAFMNAGKQFSSKNSTKYFMEIRDSHIKTQIDLANDIFTTQEPEFITKPSQMTQTAPFAITNTFTE
jgi:hypothetical protein